MQNCRTHYWKRRDHFHWGVFHSRTWAASGDPRSLCNQTAITIIAARKTLPDPEKESGFSPHLPFPSTPEPRPVEPILRPVGKESGWQILMWSPDLRNVERDSGVSKWGCKWTVSDSLCLYPQLHCFCFALFCLRNLMWNPNINHLQLSTPSRMGLGASGAAPTQFHPLLLWWSCRKWSLRARDPSLKIHL